MMTEKAARIAELEREIETLEAVDGLSILSEQAQANVTHTLAKLRAELARLRNESPALGEGSEPVGTDWQKLLDLSDELCEAVDNAGEDIGGDRGSLTILREIGPVVSRLKRASPPPLPAGDPRVREALEEVRRWFKGRLQGKPVGDPGNALADLEQAITLLPSPQSQGLVEAAEGLSNFAWSAIKADCDEARDHLNELLAGLRTELALVRASDRSA